jgi:5-methylcytosine-specific restriction protein A
VVENVSRKEFGAKVKKLAWQRCGGFCEGKNCGLPLGPLNRPNYDHIVADGLGGDNTLENCQVLGELCCHAKKTHGEDGDRSKMNKADRLRKKHLGIIRPNSKLAKRNRWNP